MIGLAVFALIALARLLPGRSGPPAQPPPHAMAALYGFEVVREYPHDGQASTQGLVYQDGYLYESSGPLGRSSLRKVRLETGEVLQRRRLANQYFAEGLTVWGARLIQLTPVRTVPTVPATLERISDGGLGSIVPDLARHLGLNTGSTYDLSSFEPQSSFAYKGEGWGLTSDGRRLILSDGTSRLRFFDPDTFEELGQVQVTDDGRPVGNLNELEFVEGEVFANLWREDRIAIISPDSGRVTGWIDMTGIESRMLPAPDRPGGAVLNGIAYDLAGGRLFVTGKLWPRLFEIRLRKIR